MRSRDLISKVVRKLEDANDERSDVYDVQRAYTQGYAQALFDLKRELYKVFPEEPNGIAQRGTISIAHKLTSK